MVIGRVPQGAGRSEVVSNDRNDPGRGVVAAGKSSVVWAQDPTNTSSGRVETHVGSSIERSGLSSACCSMKLIVKRR